MTEGQYFDLSTIFGRLVAGLRKESGKSQATLAAELSWDRSLLSRIESGRNTANIDNIIELEQALKAMGLIVRDGDLNAMVVEVARELKKEGFRPAVGVTPKPPGEEPVPAPALDRIVGRVLHRWLKAVSDQRGRS